MMKYAIMMLTTGVRIKGINITGLRTIGRPKIIGSLMPKIPGATEIFARSLIRFELQNKSIAISRESVEPPPPKVAKKVSNSRLTMLGSAAPAANAA